MILEDTDQLIILSGLSVPYLLTKGRKGRVKLTFSDDGKLVIETGNGKLGNFERQFLKEKSKWLRKHYPSILRQAKRKSNFLANIDQEIELLGGTVPLEYVIDKKTSFKVHEPLKFTIFAPQNHILERKNLLLYYALRAYADKYLRQKGEEWAEVCELEFNRIRVKDHKTKWGSCSSLRNINLNWHLVLLDEPLIDYVIIHELMHLHELNHSKRFWNWVGKYHPQYKVSRQEIKEKQWLIGILS